MGRDRRVATSVARKAIFPNARHVCALALCVLAVACHKDDADSASATGATTASVKPVDHLAPGELLEGPEKAFGVALPKEMAVERRFVDVVYAAGSPPPSAVAKYFSSRVEGGKVTTGDRGTTFDGVHAPGNANVTLRVEVATSTDGPFAGRGSHVTLRDITAPKPADLPDESARWNAAGLTPDGKVADPKHLH